MNRADFISKILEPSFASIMELNVTKGHDYAGDEDALANFKRNAERLKLTPEQVLMVYLGKHLDAIYTYCSEGQVESEPIEGRIDDAILYLLLLKGLVYEANSIQAGKINGGDIVEKARWLPDRTRL